MVIENINFIDAVAENGSIVVGVYSDGELSPNGQKIDQTLGGEISKAIQKIEFSEKKLYENFSLISSSENYKYIFVVSLGEKERQFSKFELEKLGAKIYVAAKNYDENLSILLGTDDIACEEENLSLLIAFGLLLRSWDFDKYKPSRSKNVKLKKASFLVSDVASAEENFVAFKNIADSVFLTRLMVSEPANVIYPESYSEIIKQELLPLGVSVEIFDKEALTAHGMNALLAVGQGSANESRLAILQWNGGEKDQKPYAFVGKGVTFDSGGISIKPDEGMQEMRHDMAGSAVVLGLMKAIALNKLPINVVGLMPMVENMPSGTAQRPGDIIKTMSGQTIEVLSTDAEGRLILADALWYAQKRFSPEAMIDIATLTGAVVVALGHEFAGVLSNDDELCEKIVESSKNTGEKVWRLPLSEHFDKGIESDIADIQNIGRRSVRAGTITAAQFLKRFVNNVKWAHLDIAGVEITSDDLFLCSHGATGFGVHLLYDFLQQKTK